MTFNPPSAKPDNIPLALDIRHGMRIIDAVAVLNCAVAQGRSALPQGLVLLDAIAALQSGLRAVLEAERGGV